MTIFIFLPGVFFLQVSQSVFTLNPGVKICLQSFRVPLFLPAVKGFAFSVPRSSLTSSHSSLSPLLPGGILLLPNLFPLELLILNKTLSLFVLIEDFPFSADSFCSALSWHWIILLPNSDHKKLFSKPRQAKWKLLAGEGQEVLPGGERGPGKLPYLRGTGGRSTSVPSVPIWAEMGLPLWGPLHWLWWHIAGCWAALSFSYLFILLFLLHLCFPPTLLSPPSPVSWACLNMSSKLFLLPQHFTEPSKKKKKTHFNCLPFYAFFLLLLCSNLFIFTFWSVVFLKRINSCRWRKRAQQYCPFSSGFFPMCLVHLRGTGQSLDKAGWAAPGHLFGAQLCLRWQNCFVLLSAEQQKLH